MVSKYGAGLNRLSTNELLSIARGGTERALNAQKTLVKRAESYDIDPDSFTWVDLAKEISNAELTLAESKDESEDTSVPTVDTINPRNYKSHPSGVECIQVIEHMTFNLGNVVKYIWRADLKNGVEDLKKARWYLYREIARLEKSNDSSS